MVLNFVVTSNHIHLIVKDDGDHNVIPQSIGLIAGRTAQEYKQRKNRKGAFWEDRYHSIAIETGKWRLGKDHNKAIQSLSLARPHNQLNHIEGG